MSGEFQNGLCGCFNNCGVCVCTFLVPCYIAGKVGEKVGDSCCLCCLVMFVPVANLICRAMVRQKVRDQKGIPGNLCTDLLTVFCCATCALCQEAAEVDALHMSKFMAVEQEIPRE